MNDNTEIPDNMLSAFIDGNCSDLERLICTNSKHESQFIETIDIVNDIKDGWFRIEQTEPVTIFACEKFISDIELFKELKDYPDRGPQIL